MEINLIIIVTRVQHAHVQNEVTVFHRKKHDKNLRQNVNDNLK